MSEDAPVVSDQMAAEDSLWHEIRKLAKIRKAHPALCASGTIEFVYCEPQRYPLTYLRTAGDERILVALNPSQSPVSCECPYGLHSVLYTLGESVKIENGKLIVPGESAGFVKVG